MAISNQLIRRSAVEQVTGMSRSTIYRRIDARLFPTPVSIGGSRVAWVSTEIEALNNAGISGKSDVEIKSLVVELEALRHAKLG